MKNPGEIALITDKLPATVTMQEDALTPIRQSFAKSVGQIEFSAMPAVFHNGLLAVALGCVAGAATVGGWPAFFFGGVVAFVFGTISGAGQCDQISSVENQVDKALSEARDAIGKEYRAAQVRALGEKMDQAVALADECLAKGGLIDEDILAHLVTIPAEKFRKASDQLAISVLQARSLLAHVRANEGAAATAPMTFALLKEKYNAAADPSSADSRRLLRDMLGGSDGRIAEENYEKGFPAWDPAAVSGLNTNGIREVQEFRNGVSSFLGLPFLARNKRLAAAMKDIRLPDAASIEVKVPALRPVENFSEIVALYEKRNGKLDLPAVYGWDNGSMPRRRPVTPGAAQQIP